MLNPYPILAALIAGLCIFVGGCMHGESIAEGKVARVQVKTQQADVVRVERVDAAAATVAQQNTAARVQVVTRFQPIEKEVIRYVQTHDAAVCLDADGLRVWRAANLGEFEDASAPSGGRNAVPGANTADERNGQRPARQPRGNDEGLPRMQGSPGEPGALDTDSETRTGDARE